jgi:hypothetical protein
VLLLCMGVVAPAAAADDDNPLGMSYVETAKLRLIWFEPLGFLGTHAARTFSNALEWQRTHLGWQPSEATTFLLKDLSDYGGAGVNAAPRNMLSFDVSPVSHAFETYPATERMYSLMNHELVHVAQGDLANAQDRFWRAAFMGKVQPTPSSPETLVYSYLTVPRFTAPRWYLEGGAVFMETWMGGGLGRAQGGYDEMVFRTMVRDGAHFYDPLGLVSRGVKVDFQHTANAYLYGTRFMSWLALEYGPKKVLEWIRRDEDSARYYADQFEKVFGMPLDDAWQRWIAYEQDVAQPANLAEVRKFPITPYRRLAAGAVGSISRLALDESSGTMYGAFRYPGQVEYVGAIDLRTGAVRRLADVKKAMLYKVASIAYDPSSGTLFYTNDNLGWRDLMAVDVRTGEERMLFEDARIGELAFDPVTRALFGVRHENGFATLVRIEPPYDTWKQVAALAYGVVPYDLDVSPDGKRLSASVGESSGDQFVRVWDIARCSQGDAKPLSEFKFGQSVPESFVFSPDGKYLYGSSYYTGVSNIFRYEVATGEIKAVSNAETGFFRPLPRADGSLVVLVYTAAGFVPALIDPKPIEDVSAITFLGTRVAKKWPVVGDWQVPAASTAPLDDPVIGQGPYRPLKHVGLENAYPVLQGYKNSSGGGLRVNFSDPLRFANVSVVAAWTPIGDDLPAASAATCRSTRTTWAGAAARRGTAPISTTCSGRPSAAARASRSRAATTYLVYWDDPRHLDVKFDVAYYDKIDTLPNAQNVGTTSDRLLTGEVGVYYSNVRRSIGAVDDEKGIAWYGVATVNRSGDKTSVQGRAAFDYGWALPWLNTSVWLRTVAGASSGDRDDPVANFYFGGFGNNYVDSLSIKRYREWYSFPASASTRSRGCRSCGR